MKVFMSNGANWEDIYIKLEGEKPFLPGALLFRPLRTSRISVSSKGFKRA